MSNILNALLPGRAAAKTPRQKPSASISRCKAAARTARSPGACWNSCSATNGLAIEGISGTSAGAINAVMLADGLARGGREEAQKRLADFWRAASSTGNLPALQRAVMQRLLSFTPLEGTPVQAWFDALSRYFSPYDVNPLNINPLKDLIERFVDFEKLRADSDLQLFISATNVQTGRVRIFPRDKITADAVMASACLPTSVPRG